MLSRSFVLAAVPLLALTLANCDGHSWESTKRLYEHGGHGEHGEHGDHGDDAAHDGHDAEPPHDATSEEAATDAPTTPVPNPVLPGES